jgi:hypothetical protein
MSNSRIGRVEFENPDGRKLNVSDVMTDVDEESIRAISDAITKTGGGM